MKKYLLGGKGNFYKANLHCHTNLSDGHLTPAEVKELYKSRGYSVVAFTDHDALIPHQDLKDADFLPLNGLEISIRNPRPEGVKGKNPVVHMGFIALEEDNEISPFFHRTKHILHNTEELRRLVKFDESLPDFERDYSVETINAAIAEGKKRGFYVIYNHPIWSFETEERLRQYKGFDAMEVYNNASYILGYEEYTPALQDTLRRQGMRFATVAADDNHNKYPAESRRCDACGGWVQIEADKLEYRTITKALETGSYYASTGPKLHALWVEDGMVHVKCDPADRILFTLGGGGSKSAVAEGAPLTEASFLLPGHAEWIKITVYDEKGKFAMTRAYYPEEWLSSGESNPQ